MASAKGSIFVTGTNGGLGSTIVQQILDSSSLGPNYHGLYTVRNPERASTLKSVLQNAESKGHTYDIVPVELTSLASVRKAAEDINKRVAEGSIPPLRAIVLNAAWQEYSTDTITDDGFDMSFQSNYLSQFLLTLLLLKSIDKKNGRIVVLGSWSHDTSDSRNHIRGVLTPYAEEKWNVVFKEPLNTEPLARATWSPSSEEPGSMNPGYRRYGASKLCQIMFMRELSKRLSVDPEFSSIAVLAVDPGAMPTTLTHRNPTKTMSITVALVTIFAPVMSLFWSNSNVRPTAQSARDVINAAFDTKTLGERPNGIYLNGCAIVEAGPEARDAAKCEKLWKDSLGYAQIKDGDSALATLW